MSEAKKTDDARNIKEREQKTVHPPNHISHSLLAVGTETAVFNERSSVRARILSYASAFKEAHIIVLCARGFSESRVGDSLFLHPTNSRFRFSRIFHAWKIGRAAPNVEIVTVQDPFETGLVGWIIARSRKARLHVQVHTDFLSSAYRKLSILNRARAFLAGFILRRASRVRVVSERIKNGIEGKYHLRAPISVLPIFVDVKRFQNAKPDELLVQRFSKFRTRILVVSRLESEKNVSLAIRAFGKSAPDNACLIIVGSGRERKNLEQVAKNLGVLPRTFFEGSASPSRYYKLANILLAPSFYEGYGMTIVEALASGIPVLSTDVGAAREAGAIVASKETFTEALARWFKNGPREGILKNYPYQDFNEYVQAYCDDIISCVSSKKRQ